MLHKHFQLPCGGIHHPVGRQDVRLHWASSPCRIASQPQCKPQKACRSTTCMAHPRRIAKVSKQIEREIGSLFLSDEKMQRAVHPGRDFQEGDWQPITSVTEVRISSDLSVAKVYVSVFGSDEEQAVTLDKLARLSGYVRKHIGQAMSLRMTPEIRFFKDEFIQRGEQVLAALDQIRLQREGKISPPPIAISQNVKAAAERARRKAQSTAFDDDEVIVHANQDSTANSEEDDEDAFAELLDDSDSDAEGAAGEGIDLDAYFAKEREMALSQQNRPPPRSRRR